jgi:hypothetical protein
MKTRQCYNFAQFRDRERIRFGEHISFIAKIKEQAISLKGRSLFSLFSSPNFILDRENAGDIFLRNFRYSPELYGAHNQRSLSATLNDIVVIFVNAM